MGLSGTLISTVDGVTPWWSWPDRFRWLRLPPAGELLWCLVVARLIVWTRGRWLGIAWWLLEPAAMTLTFMFLVRGAFRADTPLCALFLLCAVLPWTCFCAGIGQALHSLPRNAAVLRSVTVSYLLFPAADVVATMIRFAVGMIILPPTMAYYDIGANHQLCWLPVIISVQTVWMLGIAYGAALLQVLAADTAHAWQVLSRIWFLLSPGIYPLSQVPAAWRSWCLWNPLAVLFSSYRQVIIHGQPPNMGALALTAVTGGLLLVTTATLLRRSRVFLPQLL